MLNAGSSKIPPYSSFDELAFPLKPDEARQEKVISLLNAILNEQQKTNERLGIIGKALLDLLAEEVKPEPVKHRKIKDK